MELVDTRTQSENATDVATIKDTLKKLIDAHADGGEITLDDFCKKVGNKVNRSEVVKLLKKSGQGVFITGRRGRQSRFVHGPPAIPFLTRVNAAQAARTVSRKSESASPAPLAPSGSTRFELQINVGGQTTTIPIDIGLALAAA
jgi:hypothetical protein